MKLFLDDSRQPQACVNFMRSRLGDNAKIYNEDWHHVKTYEEFIAFVEVNHLKITHISFDHDLAQIKYDSKLGRESFSYYETTGYDCAKWLKNFYEEKQLKLPIILRSEERRVGKECRL